MADIVDFELIATEATARVIRDDATGCFNHMRSVFLAVDGHVWANQFGLTPQEVFTALGTRAASAVDFLTRIAIAVNQQAPENLDVASSKPAGVTLTKNVDGTVTLS